MATFPITTEIHPSFSPNFDLDFLDATDILKKPVLLQIEIHKAVESVVDLPTNGQIWPLGLV